MYLAIITIVSACASYKAKYADKASPKTIQTDKELMHSFYLIGDAGNAEMGQTTPTLTYFQKELAKATKNATTLFLGDNIYPYGIPSKKHKDRALAEHRLQTQIDALQDFKGKTIFIPGNHDWYNGVETSRKNG
jgi:predicted MPP superfamily phosphohydrolase